MKIGEVLTRAKDELAAATGLKPVTITGALKDERGWHVEVEMLEMSRIPPATDVLGDYDVLLSEDGHLVSFVRKRTRLRGEAVASEKE